MSEETLFECEFYGRKFKHEPLKKNIKGKPHEFCSQSCFVLWFYDMPKNDREAFYDKYVVGVPSSKTYE